MLNLLLIATAREVLKAREFVMQNFDDYFNAGGHKHGSELVRRMYEHKVYNHVVISNIVRT